MVDEREVEELLAIGHEIRPFEVKGPGRRTDKAYHAKVMRAVLAMANLRDGGRVCIGINDKEMKAMTPGLDDVELSEWSNYDDVSAALLRMRTLPSSFVPGPST